MRTLLPVKTSEFLITQKCNLNCTYCFEKNKSRKDIDWEEFKEILRSEDFTSFPSSNIYIFGGEPLMNPEFIDTFVQYVDKHPTMGSSIKQKLIEAIVTNITTNGTLIDKTMLSLLKKYNCTVQVSLDGPKDLTEEHRVDFNGKGCYDKVMANLELCRENNIKYSLHGVVDRSHYKDFCRINEWFLEQTLLNPSRNLEQVFWHNYLQIIFEDDITDEDIDTILEQYQKTIEMILNTPLLDEKEKTDRQIRKTIAEGFLNRKGGTCSAGYSMYSYDQDFNIFPCHRLNTADEQIKKTRFGSLKEDIPFNYKLYLPFQEVVLRGEMYGAVLDNWGYQKGQGYWVNWCPSTNWETSGSVFNLPSKYDVLVKETGRLVKVLAAYYELNLDNPKFQK